MRHRKKQVKLNLKRDDRRRLLKNLVTSVILYEKVKTTEAKAKAVKPLVDKAIVIGKEKDKVFARRKLAKLLFDKNAVEKIMVELAEKYKNRKSGFTRSVRLGPRLGDAAPMVQIELIGEDLADKKPKTESKEEIKKEENKEIKRETKAKAK